MLAEPKYRQKLTSFSQAHYRKLPGIEADDLYAELQIVLWKACQAYDPDNGGASFNSFLWQCVNNKFKDLLEIAYAEKRKSDLYNVSLSGLNDADWTELDSDALMQAIDARTASTSAENVLMDRMAVFEGISELRGRMDEETARNATLPESRKSRKAAREFEKIFGKPA